MQDVLINYLGVILGSFSTVVATYHFKGKADLKQKVDTLSEEVGKLRQARESDKEVVSGQLEKLDAEMKEIKRSIRDDNNDLKNAINCVNNSINKIAEAQGEFRGTLTALLRERHPYEPGL
jgi:septal ring factor EnvC (AmiA/AmiB activator)